MLTCNNAIEVVNDIVVSIIVATNFDSCHVIEQHCCWICRIYKTKPINVHIIWILDLQNVLLEHNKYYHEPKCKGKLHQLPELTKVGWFGLYGLTSVSTITAI
jgi:hypothetical protein